MPHWSETTALVPYWKLHYNAHMRITVWACRRLMFLLFAWSTLQSTVRPYVRFGLRDAAPAARAGGGM